MFYIYAGSDVIYEPGNSDLFVLSPKLNLEMGKAGSLEFTIPTANPYYSKLTQMKTIITVFMDDTEIFRGRVLSLKRNFDNSRDVYVEGCLAYLVDTVQEVNKYNGKVHDLFNTIIANHNRRSGDDSKKFTVGTVNVENRDIILVGKSTEESDIYEDLETKKFNYKQIAINSIAEEWQNTFDYIQSCLIDYCGGYLRTRYENGVNYIDWIKDYFSEGTQSLEVGKNILDLTEEVSIEDAFTVLIPLGDENLTILKAPAFEEDGISHATNSRELVDVAGVKKYGRIQKSVVFDGVTSVDTLLENAKRFLKSNANIPTTITITAVDLSMIDDNIEAIHLGDRILVESDYHDLNDKFICTKIELDMANPANNVYTFGQPKQTLTERYKKDKKKQDDTAKRSGGGGGGGASGKASEEATGDIKEIFDAWIDCDPSKGHVSLGALYEKYDKDRATLKNKVGIDLDGPAGTINIYGDHESLDTVEGTLNTTIQKLNSVGIKLDATQAKIDIFADSKKITTIGDKTETIIQKINNVGIKLDGEEGSINIFADHTEFEKTKKILQNNLGIKLNAPQGTIDIFSSATDTATNKEHIAKIQTWAGYNEKTGKYGSNIALAADVVSINSKITDINAALTKIHGAVSIEGGFLKGNIRAYSGSLFNMSGGYATFAQHSHTISINGRVLTIGGAITSSQSVTLPQSSGGGGTSSGGGGSGGATGQNQ